MIDGFFDISFRLEELSKNGDPLVQLKGSVDWELFRQDLAVLEVPLTLMFGKDMLPLPSASP